MQQVHPCKLNAGEMESGDSLGWESGQTDRQTREQRYGKAFKESLDLRRHGESKPMQQTRDISYREPAGRPSGSLAEDRERGGEKRCGPLR